MSFSLALVQGAGMEQALDAAGKGFGTGVVTGGIAAFWAHYVTAKQNGGKPIQRKSVTNEETLLLNQFNSVESILENTTLSVTKQGAFHGEINGNGDAIFKAITHGAKPLSNGRFLLNDGTNIGTHNSFKNGFTINFNRGGQLYKIRINQ